MNSVTKAVYFGALAVFCSTAISSNFALEGCSSTQLNQPCQHQNAQQQVNCLSSRIAKIKECNNRVADYENQLKALVKKKVEEKGSLVIDPLKKAQVNHLEKMKELESILKWHDSNMESSSEEYVRLAKDFLNSYKNSEKTIEAKFQEIARSTQEVKDYLDLINIRFDIRTLQRNEESQAHRFIARSTRLIGQLQAIESFVRGALSGYAEYLDKNDLSSKIPSFTDEIDFARGVVEYAKARVAVIDSEVTQIIQRIDANIIEAERLALQRAKEIDFKDSRFIEREKSFLRDVNQLVDDALIESDLSEFCHFEYLGARYKGLERLLTLDSVCSLDNLNHTQNDWLVWGCGKYEQVRELARNQMVTQLPLMMKAALSNMEVEFQIEQRITLLMDLDAGKLEKAVETYDRLLSDYSRERR